MKHFLVCIAMLLSLTLLAGCAAAPAPEASQEPSRASSSIPEDAFPSRSGELLYVRKVAQLTGEAGTRNTLEAFDVYGTDLGIPYYDGERLTFLFGDTYAAANFSGNWRSNVALYTTQQDYSQGIVFDGALTGNGPAESGVTVQLTPGASAIFPLLQAGAEKTPLTHTCIPTGAVVLDGTTYVFYMEIDRNAFPAGGGWGVYSCRVIKSTDHGASWTQVPGLVWQAKDASENEGDAPHFAQIYPMLADGYVYLYGLSGGRSGGAKLGRVPAAQIEDFEFYEYFTGRDENGAALWKQGTNGLRYTKNRESAYVIAPACGEMCVSYNEYLGKYLATYQSGSQLVYRTADTPEGPFSSPEVILSTNEDMPGGYGAFTCPQLSDQGGKRIWLIVSQWTPVYNVSQVEVVFR